MDNENNKEKEGENADSKKVAVAKTEDSDVAKQIEGEAKPDAAKKDEAEHALDDFEDKEVEIVPVIVQEEDAVIISEDEESVITDVYDEEDFKSMALLSPHSTIPIDTFEPIHSYGYDCQHHYNICACDQYVVAWAAGSYITFYNIKTKALSFRRSSTGGSIGHITKNPKFSHIAVGEGGLHWAPPIIIVYQWPSMTMVAALREGTKRSYANLDYSPDGNLLASVGGPPDYNLTIWDWQKHRIMLQTSAFSYTVNNVQFSPYIPGQLTTSGASHIKFWKMCPTFTGLKLKGELGRFGKTEICDILGVMPMPDEKVLSGCSWGNILVWENGLVKVEVCRRGRNTCHEAPITQFLRCPETTEVTTVGLDGCIRTWYWDTVEQADPPENDPTIELNPVAELRVEGAQLMSISQRKGTEWFGQDAGGCIWTLDLDVDSPECGVPERQVQWHGGPLVGLAVLRGLEPLLVSLGCDGTLALAPIPAGPLLYLGPSAGEATTMLYLPKKVDRTGRTLLIGYSDGTCRLFILFTHELSEKKGTVTDDSCQGLLQQLKPHKDKVNVISMNPQCSILVTVSTDCTLFMYQVQTKKNVPELVPLCYIDTPKIINYISWKPGYELVMLLAGEEGLIMEAELPLLPGPPPPDTITYQDYFASTNIINLKEYILRYTPPDEEDEMPYVGSDEEEEEKKDSDEEEEEEAEVELFEQSAISKKSILWAVHDPLERDSAKGSQQLWVAQEVLGCLLRIQPGGLSPNKFVEQSAISKKSILWAVYDPLERDSATGSQQLWVAQEGLGCLLRIQPGGLSPNKFAPLEDSWEVNIVSMMFINENKHLVLGMEDGEVRLICFPSGDTDSSGVEFELRMVKRQRKLKRMRGKPKDEPELIPRLDFLDFLRLPMHNAQTGRITHMVFSHDERYFFTAGGDGNVFSYSYNLLPEELLKAPSSYDFSKQLMPEKVGLQLTEEELELSHEELAREKERQALQRAANQYKQRVRDQLAELTLEFKDLLKKNNTMPLSQQVEVEVDERVLAEEERVAEERMALVRRKMAFPLQVSQLKLTKMLHRNIHPLEMFPFQLNSILNKEFNVKTIRQNKLTQDFFDELEVAKINLIEAIKKAQGSVEKDEGDEEDRVAWGLGGPPMPLLQGLPPVPPPPRALVRALRNYLQRINRHHKQEMEWQDHLGNRSFSSVERAGAAAIADAEASIGEFHLKSRPAGAQGPTQPHLDPAPLQQAHVNLFITRQEIYEIQSNFNKSLVKLKEEKVALTKRYAELTTRLAEISEDIPKNMRQSAPLAPPTMNPELEDPASNIKVQMADSQRQRRSIASSRRRSIFFIPPPVIVGEKQSRKAVERDPSTNYWDMMKDESKEIRAKVGTPLEEYYKERHVTSLLVEQEQIILEMKESVDGWEERLKELSRERERAQLKAHYLRLHLLYLTQRHLVLDSFQLREDEVGEQVRLQQAELKVAQDELKVLNKQIEHLRSGIAGNQETIRQLEVQQRKVAADAPKFAKFLRHIYKKKQKPPKLENDESSESEDSEEESSSEEEESEASDEGAETVRLRLDSTMCPPGCDPQIYEEIINFRQIRYDLENDIKEQERQIELSKKSVDFNNREARTLVRKLEERQKVLYDLLQTKQGLLNDIECLVVVSASCCASDALESVLQGDHACVRAGVLLFPAPLIAQLKDRIAQLHTEAMEQKLRHSINQSHLRHMKVDCKSMEQRLAGLRAQCQLLLTNKLNLHELKGSDKDNAQISGMSRAAALLDAVLGEMSYAFKVAAATGFTLDMQEQLAQWKKREVELEQQYCAVLQEHTEKLRIASALQAETLIKESSKTIKDMLGGRTEEEYRQDIVRLRRLRKEQKKQIEELKAEVHRLKLKPLSCQPALPPPPSPCATSISVPPTGRDTPAPAPPLYDTSIKTVATTLATCLIESGLEVITDLNMDKCLLDEIADVLPFLVIGKLSISTATNRILKKLSLSCDTEENIIKAKQCKSCIADILRQIVKENLVLGEMSPLVQLARSKQREQEEGTKDVQRALVGAVVSLLELGASTQLVDAVVATLLTEHPEVVEQTIHAEELLEVVQDEIDISDEETGLDVVRTMISCILAQALEPGEANAVAEEIRELQKSASSVSIQPKASKSALRNVSSVVSTARSTSQVMKKVSVVDAKSEASVSAPAKGSRTSQGESAKGSNTSRQGQSAKGSKTSQKSDRT